MNLPDLMQTLSQQGIELWVEGDKLRFRAPQGTLSLEIREQISSRKDEIRAYLRQEAAQSTITHPLSYGQQSFWFVYRMLPNSAAFNVAFTARFRSVVDFAALKNAFQGLVDRHAALRTTYADPDGLPVQHIHGYMETDFTIVDAANWTEDALRDAVIRDYRQPFDLEHGSIMRTRIYSCAPDNHVALMAAHHIAADGWSVWLIMDELRQLYAAYSTGKSAGLPKPEIPYTQFVEWQKELLEGEEGQKLWDYWQQKLAGDIPTLNLPMDRVRPAVQAQHGASYRFTMNEALTEKMKTLARNESTTLYTLILSVYQVLLSRYSGQNDIVVGSPMTGRTRPEFAGIVGEFVNMIVLRGDLSGNPTFRDFLAQMRETSLGAIEHQDYPLGLLTARLRPDRDLSRSPLFQVDFVLQKPQASSDLATLVADPTGIVNRINFGGLEMEPYYMPQQEGQLDLTLEVIEREGSLMATFKYNVDIFNESTIARMVTHFQTLLNSIVTNPDEHISAFTIMSEDERQQLLVNWNNTAVNFDKDVCTHNLFEAQAARNPEAVAVVYEGQSLTYGELNSRTNQLAHYVQSLKVGPEVRVGIHLDRSLNLIVAVMGVLKAGGAYLPLDPTYPADRLAFMVEDAQIPVLITEKKLVGSLPAGNAQIVQLDTDWERIALEETTNPSSNVQPNDLAYVIYTSGSTGRSKGVMVEHRSLVNAYYAWETAYKLQSTHRHLQMASFSFDVFSGDFVRALCSGGRLVLCPRETLLDAAELYQLMRQESVNYAEFVPAVLRHLIQYLEDHHQRLDFMSLLACGSDSWTVKEYQYFQSFCGAETRLINSFGLSETTIDSSYYENRDIDVSRNQLVPIGRPFANTQFYILDPQMQPVPVAVPGELYIGGAGLARGYLNRPELTAERFVVNPFTPGTRLYKTGDLARYLPDSNVEFLGRMDFQVKIRGYRVELGEIEAALDQHAGVRQTIVMMREDTPDDKFLVAYFVADDAANAPSSDELSQYLRTKLPTYMVPSAIIRLDAMPLSPNGKINRRALPAPEMEAGQPDAAFVAPRTPFEHDIAAIWSEILVVAQVSVYENFFELGGHSLRAMQVVTRLRRQFGTEIPIRALFENPTVADLALFVAQQLINDEDEDDILKMIEELKGQGA